MPEVLENMKMMENIEDREESVFDKIEGLKAEVNQIERMIEENIRMIEKGDDVEGRTYLKKHLESEVSNKKEEIVLLEKQL